MNTNNCGTELPGAIENFRTLLEQLRAHIQQHGEALTRMNLPDIEQEVEAEQLIFEQLAEIRSQLDSVPLDIVERALSLRRLLHAQAALIAKSKASVLMLLNICSASHPRYPEQERRALACLD